MTGAGGFIGAHVAARLADDGHAVTGLVRRLPQRAGQAGRLRWVQCDLASTSEPLAALHPVDCVIHLAGRAHRTADGDSQAEMAAYMRQNCAVAVKVAEDAARRGASRLILMSSIAVYGDALDDVGATIDEETETAPRDPYGRSKLAAETELREVASRTGLELVILRPALVVGAGAPGNLRRLLGLIDRRVPIPVPIRDNCRSYLGLGNLYELLTKCIIHPRAAGEVFIAADAEYASTRELIGWIADGMRIRALTVPMPRPLIRLLFAATGKTSVYRKLYGDLRVSSSKARTLLQWEPTAPLADSFRDLGRGRPEPVDA